MTPTDDDENENDLHPFSPALLPFGLLIEVLRQVASVQRRKMDFEFRATGLALRHAGVLKHV